MVQSPTNRIHTPHCHRPPLRSRATESRPSLSGLKTPSDTCPITSQPSSFRGESVATALHPAHRSLVLKSDCQPLPIHWRGLLHYNPNVQSHVHYFSADQRGERAGLLSFVQSTIVVDQAPCRHLLAAMLLRTEPSVPRRVFPLRTTHQVCTG